MASLFGRIEQAIGDEFSHVAGFANTMFRSRIDEHGHVGMAVIETIAEICREHPNIVGIIAGVAVERMLVAEKHHHEARLAAEAAAAAGAKPRIDKKTGTPMPPKKATRRARLKKSKRLRPLRIAFEVFGAVIALKLTNATTRLFHGRHHGEVWFAPIARIHAISAALAAYALVSAINDPKLSALRNGAILFFGTDAIKPVLNWYWTHPAHVASSQTAVAVAPEVAAEAYPQVYSEPNPR